MAFCATSDFSTANARYSTRCVYGVEKPGSRTESETGWPFRNAWKQPTPEMYRDAAATAAGSFVR
jgi:hypothetical protein